MPQDAIKANLCSLYIIHALFGSLFFDYKICHIIWFEVFGWVFLLLHYDSFFSPYIPKLGWFKTPVSSQTQKMVAATKFSDYLGLKHYKKAKKLKHFIHLRLANQPQSFNTYRIISPRVNSGHQLKKYVTVI